MEDHKEAYKDLMKVILSYRDYYGNHHDHKEKVIYITAGIFLPLLGSVKIWDKDNLFPLDIVIILLTSITILLFMRNQFKSREDAARIVEACTDLIAKLLNKDDRAALMIRKETFSVRTWRDGENKFPGILVELLESDTRCYNHLKFQKSLIYITMSIWTIAVLVYILIINFAVSRV